MKAVGPPIQKIRDISKSRISESRYTSILWKR
jgi:hypothetical protein